ncbi:MAG: O-antigen ligase family protein [Planctomycetota bacterium]
MKKGIRQRPKPTSDEAARAATAAARAGWLHKTEAFLLGVAVALMVAAMLIPSEAAVAFGSHVILVMAWLVLTAAWLTRCLCEDRPTWHVGPVAASLGVFLALHSVSALVMLDPGHGRPTLNALWLWISFGLLFLTLRQLARRPVEQRAIVSVLLAMGVGLSTFGVYQAVWVYPRIRLEYQQNPDQVLREAGFHDPGPAQRRHFQDRLNSTEPVGPFALTNSLAGVLVSCVVLLAGLSMSFWHARGHWHGSGVVTLCLLMLMAAILLTCLLATKSRAGYLATLAGLGGLLVFSPVLRTWLRRRWPWATAMGAGLLLIAVCVAGFGGLDRELLTEASKSLRYRFEYWQSSAAMIADHPWWGCGPGNFKDYYTQYKLPQASETIADPHNFLMEVAATAGLPALVAFVLTGLVLIRRVARPRNSRTEAAQTPAAPSAARPVYLGAVGGFLLAYPAGWAGAQSPAIAMLFVALPVTLLALRGLMPWVARGNLTASPLLVAAGALLVNLLAAGGISLPGVAGILWTLFALALNGVEDHEDREQAVANPDSRRWCGPVVARAAIGLATAGALLAGVLSYFTMYRPVLAGHKFTAFRSQIQRGGGPRVAEAVARESRKAAKADPWWAEPCDKRAEALHYLWLDKPSSQRLAAFQEAAAAARRRNPQSSELASRQGQRLMAMYAASGHRHLLQDASEAYARAVSLYPNSSLLRARRAWAYHVAGQSKKSRREARLALELDRQMPHQELKLKHQSLNAWAPNEQERQPPPAGQEVNAEQLMRRLRTRTSKAPQAR